MHEGRIIETLRWLLGWAVFFFLSFWVIVLLSGLNGQFPQLWSGRLGFCIEVFIVVYAAYLVLKDITRIWKRD